MTIAHAHSLVHRAVIMGDNGHLDAFGRLRISQPVTLFDSKQINGKQAHFWDEELGDATATHVPAGAKTTLALLGDGASAGYAIRQTFMRFPYQPGKSQLWFMTYRATAETGVTKRIGQFRATTATTAPINGIFFEQDGDTASWCIANGGTINRVSQSDWNIDPLNGTGPSEWTYNPSAAGILVADYEWLGTGRVRVGFVIRGQLTYVHEFWHANESGNTGVYMATPNLPLCYTIKGDTATRTGSMDTICSTVISEAGLTQLGHNHSINNGTTPIDCASTSSVYALLGIRLNSSTLDTHVKLSSVSAVGAGSKDLLLSIRFNPTVAGTPAWVTNTPPVDYFIGVQANTVTGGDIMDSFYLSGAGALNQLVELLPRLGASIAGVRDTIVLCARPLTANVSTYGSLTWSEQE